MVGILNLTPDSFSDGGEFSNLEQAQEHFDAMLAAGADMIDIGGESTRPGHQPITIAEEIDRVIPFIERIRLQSDGIDFSGYFKGGSRGSRIKVWCGYN